MDVKGLALPFVSLAFEMAGTARIPCTLKLGATSVYDEVTDSTVSTPAHTVTLKVIRMSAKDIRREAVLPEPLARQTVIMLNQADLPEGVKVQEGDVAEIEGDSRKVDQTEEDPISATQFLYLA